MNGDVIIEYNGEQVSVPKEVADFLEEDRKRMAAQERRDRRHLSRSSFEQLSFLHISHLRPRDRELISMRYEDRMTLAAIGEHRGVSKMAVSKQLKKVHDVLGHSVE